MKRKIGAILLVVALVVTLGLVPAASVGASPGPGIVGLWHLDGDATDSSGNGNNGTEQNLPTYSSDQWTGQAINLDGSNQYVDCGSNIGSFGLTDSFTIEAWINPALDSTDDVIYGNAFASPGYHVRITFQNKVRFILMETGSIYNGIDSSVLSSGWHHIAAVWDGTDPKIYVDGIDDSQTTVDNGTVTTITTTNHTKIGLDTVGWGHYFKGKIDEVRVWDTATPSFNLDVSPPEDFNPVGDDHEVTATVTIDRVDDGEEVAPGVKVDFDITGPNSGESTTKYTQSDGVATLTYTSDGTAGEESIAVSIDWDWCAPAAETVEKYWLEHYVTGGGLIETGKGKDAAKITFGGNVGFDLAGNKVGQWQCNFHNVNNDALDKGHFHSTEIVYIDFKDYPALPDPSPPEADVNYVRFDALGKFNGEYGWKIRVNATDFGEGNKPEPDEIRIRLWNGNSLVYDSCVTHGGDFPDESFHVRTDLDGGNIQIHPPELPTP